MNATISITHDTQANKQIIINGLKLKIKQTLQQNGLNHYATMTLEEKRRKLDVYKNIFSLYKNLLNNTDNLEVYFQAYEQILQFRKFILGDLGKIDYTFVIKAKDQQGFIYMNIITLGSQDFANLIKDDNGKIIKLKQDGDNIRISGIIPILKQLINTINNNGMNITIAKDCSHFSITNDQLGTKEDFTSGKLFKAKIEALQRQAKVVGTWYKFDYEINKDNSPESEVKTFSLEITNAHNSPESSSVFSAIGKYFADEMLTKQQIANKAGVSLDPKYPNAGNLTELYILAKARLNQGKNNFYPRKPVKGQNLFALYKQVKSNIDPFYSGGDFLMNQIKSFLGSNPSLTSYKTIRESINNFYQALNQTNIQVIKEKLSKLLLQKPSTAKNITQSQQQLSENIAKAFEQFFNIK